MTKLFCAAILLVWAMTSATGRCVLVVEDHADCRESLRILLSLWGHTVRVAEDGAAGVQEALTWRPPVALVDLDLPVLHGCEVARRVRTALADCLLIAVTGYGRPQDRDDAIASGFDVHLAKPVEPAVLRHLLSKSPQDVRAAAPLLLQSQELREAARRPRPLPAPRKAAKDVKTYQMRFPRGTVRIYEKPDGLALFRAGDEPPNPSDLSLLLNRAVERWLSRREVLPRKQMSVRLGGNLAAIYLHFEPGRLD